MKKNRSVDGVRSSPRFCGRTIYEANTHEQMEQPSSFSFLFFSFSAACSATALKTTLKKPCSVWFSRLQSPQINNRFANAVRSEV